MDSNSTSKSSKVVSAVLLILVILIILFVATWVHRRHARLNYIILQPIPPRLRQRAPLDDDPSLSRRLGAVPPATFDSLRPGLVQKQYNVGEESKAPFPPSARWNHSLDSTDSEDAECIICTEYFVNSDRVRVLPCAHVFHQHCVDRWLLKSSKTCPTCRHRLKGIWPSSTLDLKRPQPVVYRP